MQRQTTRRRFLAAAGATGVTLLAGCTGGTGDTTTTTADQSGGMTTTDGGTTTNGGGTMGGATPVDPETAPRASVDRFSEAAGTLMVRTADNDLPGADEPIDFDQMPFITRGLGPDGEVVRYYNFDVQSTTPAPIYVLFREGADAPVPGQRNVLDVVPGDDGYNDFWQVHAVTVPEDYEANVVTSLADIDDAGYEVTVTDTLVNCPVVPAGSTASMRYGDGDAGLVEGWYRKKIVTYFQFTEAPLSTSDGSVPVSPIYVTFNANPGEDGGGPPSGFRTEMGSDQTHNVVATLPDDAGYSPLWYVSIYDTADFESVSDLDSAADATVLASGAATVNCPIVAVE